MALSTNIYAEINTTFPASVVGSGGITVAKSGGVYTITFTGSDVALNTIGLDKIEQIATDRLLGRDTDATGDIEQLTVGGGIEFTGSGGIQSSAHTGDVTKAAGGTATTIANDAVTTDKILDGAVTTAKIADDSVDSEHYVDGSIDTAHIADNQVTLAKLATQADATVLANVSGSAAIPSAQTLTAVLDDMLGSTQGDILYRDASAWAALGFGTSGHFLKTQGTGANPIWAAATATAADGSVIGSAYGEYATNTSLSTTIPFDDTIPQNTEGTQILSVSITPSATTSKIRIRFNGTASHGSAGQSITAAIFKDSGASAIATDFKIIPGNGYLVALGVEYVDSPATTSAVTYKVRVGAGLGNMSLNGQIGSRYGGGTMVSSLTLEEIKGS